MKSLTYHAALGGLAAVIIALAAFSQWSAVRTSHASSRATSATRLSDVYQDARFAVGEEESLERKYRLEPGRDVRARYAAAAGSLTGALRQIHRIGTPSDRALAAELLRRHARFLTAIDEMFAAVDAGDTARVLYLDAHADDPQFAVIEGQVDAAAGAQHAAALSSLQSLRRTEGFVMAATPIAVIAGLALLGLFAVMLVRLHRDLARYAEDREHAALHDPLTGLANRALFGDRLAHAIAAATREPAPLAVMMMDLDRFKEVNDTLGHAAGDRLLQAVGSRLESTLRPGDTVARLGGDEFALLLAGVDADGAREVGARVRAALRQPFELPTISVSVDASIGTVIYPDHGGSVDVLMQRVDVAMYVAKEQHDGQALYDPLRDPHDAARLALAADLRRAIACDELELHYQPKFRIADLQLVGVEALARWRHPEHGLLGPDQFIALAEHTGLMGDLTLLVLRKAARQVVAWEAQGYDIDVAVNLSVTSLLDANFADDVRRILTQADVSPSRLQFELTESTLMTDTQRATELLEQLADLGIAVSIDDYGTGYSSLAYLHRLPVDEIKIDRSFVSDLAASDGDAAIVRSTIELGHTLKLRVVAEGVENQDSLDRLRDFGCDIAQGYHLARPMTPDALLEHLVERAVSPRPA